jgi:DNA-binding NarL/FixJ family response regulator
MKILLVSDNFFTNIGIKELLPQYDIFVAKPQEEEIENSIIENKIDIAIFSILDRNEEANSRYLNLLKFLSKSIPTVFIKQDNLTSIPNLLSLGIKAIVEQDLLEEQLRIAIETIQSGAVYYPNLDSCFFLLAPLVSVFYDAQIQAQKLSLREREILNLFVAGRQPAEIRVLLGGIPQGTFTSHLNSIRSKLGCKSNREIISKYQILNFAGEDLAVA